MLSKLAGLACVVSLATAPSVTAQAPLPASLELDGSVSVRLAAQARRAHLVGAVDLYRVAVYANVPLRDGAALSSSDEPKAIRVDVIYKPDLHRPLPIDWQRELIPGLDAGATAELRRIFMPLRGGDVLQIDYTREKGTTVRVNRDLAVSRGSHDVLLAFLDHWIGQRPLSEEMKQALLR